MMPANPRVFNDFPTSIAYTYSLIFDEARDASVRRWALCYCEYQLLRCVALPMVGQYLRADLGAIDLARDKPAEAAVKALNTTIAGIRAPFFSDWITLVETSRKRLPALGLRPIIPDLVRALDALKDREAHEFEMPGEPQLTPLRAILALRNARVHGAVADEPDHAARAVAAGLELCQRVEEFNGRREVLGLKTFAARVEISTGAAVLGNVGTYDLMSFTAIGTTVNLGIRLEAEGMPGFPCISRQTYEQVRGRFRYAKGCSRSVTPKGLEELGEQQVWDVIDKS
jgi:Adenylate and Guanylate cyclase catalytic domain